MKELRVIIVEDEAIILRRFIMCIEKMGHHVVGVALNGNDAVQLIKNNDPDMVLIDINLPEKDGLTVIKESCLEKMIPTIIITGHFSEKLVDQANVACVYGYLMKPVRGEAVEAAVKIAWSRREEYIDSQKQTDEYKFALENRKLVERAKGILMDDFGLKENEAMIRLQKMAKDKRKKLAVVAQELIKNKESLL